MRRAVCAAISTAAALAAVAAGPALADGEGHGGGEGSHGRVCPQDRPVELRSGDTSTCYPTIQSAVDASKPGDEVIAEPGTYRENVTIPSGKDNLTVRSRRGASDTRIIGQLNGSSLQSVVEIDASGVRLGGDGGRTGFTIENGTATTYSPAYDLHGVGIGFDGVSHTTGVRVTGNHIQKLIVPGTLPANTPFGRVDGVAATNTSQAVIRLDEIGPIDVALDAGSNNVFAYGVIFFGTNTQPTVDSNSIHNIDLTGGACGATGAFGVAINDATASASVSDSEVSRIHADCRSAGISSGAPGVALSITGNRVADVTSATNQSSGLALKGTGASVTVSRNLLTRDGAGVAVLKPLASDTHINYNDLIRNPIGVYNNSDPNLDATLNYWGCPDGPGAPGCDTIVDVPPGHTNYIPFLSDPATGHDRGDGRRGD